MPQTKQQQRQTDRPISPVLSLVLFLQLAQLSPTSVLALQLIIKALECYWTFYRSLYFIWCVAKSENWILTHAWRSKTGVTYKNLKNLPDSDLLGGSWSTRGWIFLWSLKLGHLLLFCKLFFLSAVTLFISCRVETYLQGINCIPTLLLIVFDWAGNQSWNACKVWLVPAAWNWWHISTAWNKWQCWSVWAFALIQYDKKQIRCNLHTSELLDHIRNMSKPYWIVECIFMCSFVFSGHFKFEPFRYLKYSLLALKWRMGSWCKWFLEYVGQPTSKLLCL